MSCRTIMNAEAPSLNRRDTVAVAVQKLFAERRLSLPVIDDDRHYLGLFGSHQLLKMVLPRAADLAVDLAFVRESKDDVQKRLKAVAEHPVERYVDREAVTLAPDTPLVEALLLLYRGREDLPVVDKETHRLEGIVSARRAMAKLMMEA
jgi:CBS-domain-containing membrane protein